MTVVICLRLVGRPGCCPPGSSPYEGRGYQGASDKGCAVCWWVADWNRRLRVCAGKDEIGSICPTSYYQCVFGYLVYSSSHVKTVWCPHRCITSVVSSLWISTAGRATTSSWTSRFERHSIAPCLTSRQPGFVYSVLFVLQRCSLRCDCNSSHGSLEI